jgi:hypothetical protein
MQNRISKAQAFDNKSGDRTKPAKGQQERSLQSDAFNMQQEVANYGIARNTL